MLDPGQILDGKYEIKKVLGQGGMGTVYLCENKRLGNLWAVKEINSQWKEMIDFLAEPNILKNLSHTGIVRIIDIFYEDDNLYLVEDYIEGKTLKEHVDDNGPLPSELVKDITLQLCSILDYLHNLTPSIIYRDLKPSNIMITPYNKVVLIDFGIARTYKEGKVGDTVVLGSKGYIAPEQLVNIQSNVKTDIYSLGITMFFMLTGKPIGLPTELKLQESYPEDTDKNLVKVVQKASAIDPENRYSDIKSMINQISASSDDVKYNETVVMNSRIPDEEYNETVAMSLPTDEEEYKKTTILNSPGSATEIPKTVLSDNKKHKKRNKLIAIIALACIIAFGIFLSSLISNKTADKDSLESQVSPKTVEKTEQPAKEVIERDTIVKGILDFNNPVILSVEDNDTKDKNKNKNKDKNKDKNLQFILNPAASITNSKISISLTRIVKADDDIMVVLAIENKAYDDLKLDLSKTYLVNGENKAAKIDNLNSNTLLSIPKKASKQELNLYFKDFKVEGSQYTLKTVLNSAINKEINLGVEVKGMPQDD
ncbi:MAG: serine/threonine-protein kinase [Clostridiaceae bacterium]